MDFMHRGTPNQSQPVRGTTPTSHTQAAAVTGGPSGTVEKFKESVQQPQWLRIATVVLLFSLTVLGVALVILLWHGKTTESELVDGSKYQTVVLENNQAFFGKIQSMNDQFIDLQEVYYLNSSTSTDKEAKTNLSLIKLGCELHAPTDRMVINRDKVTFWENSKDDSKVVEAINKWKTDNKDGQKCTAATTSETTQTNPQPAAQSTAPATGTTKP